jgi:putative hydrolase of the HAD superfamily
LVSVYRSHNPDIRPFEDAVPVLEELSRQKLGLGLVSDGYLETQRNKFDALGLAHFFQANAVVFSDTWGRDAWKPSSRPYLTALAALNVEGQHAVYVGDNPSKDFKGARGVGMKSIRIRSRGGGYAGGEPESNDFEPDFEVTTIREVLGIIDRIVAA